MLLFGAVLFGLVSCNATSTSLETAESENKNEETTESIDSVEAVSVATVMTTTIDKMTEFPISWVKRDQDGFYHICVRTNTQKDETSLLLIDSKGNVSECNVKAAGIGLSMYVRAQIRILRLLSTPTV